MVKQGARRLTTIQFEDDVAWIVWRCSSHFGFSIFFVSLLFLGLVGITEVRSAARLINFGEVASIYCWCIV